MLSPPLLLMMRVYIGQCGELSNASTVPYRTVAVSRYYCRTVRYLLLAFLVTFISCYWAFLVSRIHSVIRIS